MPTNSSTSKNVNFKPIEVFSTDQLEELVQRIIDSGELGRSKIYVSLLKFLVAASVSGKRIKEFDIAFEVLGKSADFDLSKNSAVRVCVHQLRKKLDSYYSNHEQTADYRIVIPSGRYTIEAVSLADSEEVAASFLGKITSLFNFDRTLLVTLTALLAANLLYMLNQDRGALKDQRSEEGVWKELLDDNLPVMFVLGDYYVYGEENATGDIDQLVSEFNTSSKTDLDNFHLSDVLNTQSYIDMDLAYMPEGSAFVLAKIVPVFQKENKQVKVIMMTDLTSRDLRENHIIYIGYISALDKLSNSVFAMSGLQIGRNYDELVNLETQEVYASDLSPTISNQPFHDYGFFSTFSLMDSNRIVILAGMRNSGLMAVAQELSTDSDIGNISQNLSNDYGATITDFEALYEVFGIDRLNFNSRLVYKESLEPERIWR